MQEQQASDKLTGGFASCVGLGVDDEKADGAGGEGRDEVVERGAG
jgi:hypothetical protein